MIKYIVRVETANHGDFKIHTEAESCREAESIACQCVRTQFTNEIVSANGWPVDSFD
jgi:hypothetical protein